MRLLPADLPLEWHVRLAQRRANPAATGPLDAPPPRLGLLGRIWSHGSGLDQARAAALAPVTGLASNLLTWLVGLPVAMLGIPIAMESGVGPGAAFFVAMGLLFSLGLAQWAFRAAVQRPLGEVEIQSLAALARNDLEREFLGLIGDLVRLKAPAADEATLRAALTDLATAVTTLPDVSFHVADPTELREEAGRVQAAAAAETDRPTAESLGRRAEALRRQAESAERAGLLIRRMHAVREEVRAHIASLRTGLAAYQTDSGDVAGLAALAESARVVAHEAADVASARVELEEAVSAWPATPADEPAVVRAARE